MRKQLGAILVESGICTAQQVEAAIARQRELASRNHYKHLGTILLEMGSITLRQLQRALEWQQVSEAES